MNSTLRRVAVAVAAVTFSVGAVPTGVAVADETTTCPSQEEIQAGIDAATIVATDAKAAFKASLKPMGQQIKIYRHDLKAATKTLTKQLRDLRKALHKADTEEEQAAIQADIDSATVALDEAVALLGSKPDLKDEIKADKDLAKAAWHEAKAALADAEALAEECPPTEQPPA